MKWVLVQQRVDANNQQVVHYVTGKRRHALAAQNRAVRKEIYLATGRNAVNAFSLTHVSRSNSLSAFLRQPRSRASLHAKPFCHSLYILWAPCSKAYPTLHDFNYRHSTVNYASLAYFVHLSTSYRAGVSTRFARYHAASGS